MKRRAEYLVEKRDGRREWLRTAKLARSLQFALHAVEAGEEWRAMELASTVIAALRRRAVPRNQLTTAEIADAAEAVLVESGHPRAARHYVDFGAERRRRQVAVHAASTWPRWHETGAPARS